MDLTFDGVFVEESVQRDSLRNPDQGWSFELPFSVQFHSQVASLQGFTHLQVVPGSKVMSR